VTVGEWRGRTSLARWDSTHLKEERDRAGIRIGCAGGKGECRKGKTRNKVERGCGKMALLREANGGPGEFDSRGAGTSWEKETDLQKGRSLKKKSEGSGIGKK